MTETLHTPRLDLIPLEPAAIEKLLSGDRAGAESMLGVILPDEFPAPGERNGFLPLQLERMRVSPERRDWMARLMVSRGDGAAIGHCGFHGPPEVIGRAEIGYTVFTPFRGQDYAKESAGALVEWAFTQGEDEVYASIAPDNAASLAIVRSLGFTQTATQIDEVDGLELVFVRRR
jgi:RimJ/RimL family protein N-acetyltransferase